MLQARFRLIEGSTCTFNVCVGGGAKYNDRSAGGFRTHIISFLKLIKIEAPSSEGGGQESISGAAMHGGVKYNDI